MVFVYWQDWHHGFTGPRLCPNRLNPIGGCADGLSLTWVLYLFPGQIYTPLKELPQLVTVLPRL